MLEVDAIVLAVVVSFSGCFPTPKTVESVHLELQQPPIFQGAATAGEDVP